LGADACCCAPSSFFVAERLADVCAGLQGRPLVNFALINTRKSLRCGRVGTIRDPLAITDQHERRPWSAAQQGDQQLGGVSLVRDSKEWIEDWRAEVAAALGVRRRLGTGAACDPC
jgi:hypothetical protein